MHHHRYTIAYFLANGVILGVFCGLLFGTLLFPFGGQLLSTPIGAFAGAVIGLLLGISIAIYNRLYFNFDTGITQYRRVLTRNAGIGAGVLLFIGLCFPFIFEPDYIAWDKSLWSHIPSMLLWTGIISLPAALMAGLSSASVTHRYADLYARRMTKQKRDVESGIEAAPHRPNRDIFGFYTRRLFYNARWLGVLAIGAGIIIFIEDLLNPFSASGVAGLVVLAGIGAVLCMIALLNGALIRALNRVYFNEYHPDVYIATYKHKLGWISGITTLIYCVFITGIIFAPVAAFFAAWTARQYAEYRHETPEKAKRKAKDNTAADRLQLGDGEYSEVMDESPPAVDNKKIAM